jgi:hypothetical protein
VKSLLKLAVLIALAIWAWRLWSARGEPRERAAATYEDGSSLVLEPGSPGFERLAAAGRSALAG